jgi:outer membrane protein TolC
MLDWDLKLVNCCRRLTLYLVFLAAAQAQTVLSLRQAIDTALASHPDLAVEKERIAAAQALRLQSGLRPNPHLALQTENIRAHGSPGFVYGRDSDTFAILSQTLETAGKRARRVEVAETNVRRSELERELLARQIAHRVRIAYWDALSRQHIRDLMRENVRTFQQTVEYHRNRVREGAMAEVDLIRVQLESDRLDIEAAGAALDADRARIRLLQEMGQSEFPDVRLAETLQITAVPVIDADVRRALDARAEMAIARHAVEQARARGRLQRSLAQPNIEAVVGYKRTQGFNTILAGVQSTLPFADRNQGNVAAAAAELRAAERHLAATAAEVRAEVAAAAAELAIRRRQVEQTLQPLMQRAEEASRIAGAAYREGGAELLRLLDAERVRIEAQSVYYRTLGALQQSVATLEWALGVEP